MPAQEIAAMARMIDEGFRKGAVSMGLGPSYTAAATQWEVLEDDTEAPIGQKLLLVDGEDFPILEVRELTINSSAPTTAD